MVEMPSPLQEQFRNLDGMQRLVHPDNAVSNLQEMLEDAKSRIVHLESLVVMQWMRNSLSYRLPFEFHGEDYW
jgi:hypothetical protein